jgi:hypothetical protein
MLVSSSYVGVVVMSPPEEYPACFKSNIPNLLVRTYLVSQDYPDHRVVSAVPYEVGYTV